MRVGGNGMTKREAKIEALTIAALELKALSENGDNDPKVDDAIFDISDALMGRANRLESNAANQARSE